MKRSLQLLVLLAARKVAHCCSDFLLNSSFGAGCMSGRTLDFETDLGSEIGYVYPGATLTLLPICKGSPPAKLKTEHAFAFMTSARSVFQSIHMDLGLEPADVIQVVSDGMNDHGLSVTVQWDYDVPGFPNATSCNMTTSMSALDLSTYILASFSTVEEVRQALDPAHFSVVNFQLSAAAMAILTPTGLLAPGGYPLIHLGIHDAAHNSLVIEFTDNGHVLLDNPVGVLTNEPQLPGHYEQLERYMRSRFEVPQAAFQRFLPGTFAPVHYESEFYAPPGDHSSQSRFIRLAMLNRVAGLHGWPEEGSWVPTESGPSKGLWLAAENILSTIVLPPAIDDAGGAGSKNYDYSQVSILRDHKNRIYYFRSPASPQWQGIDLRSAGLFTAQHEEERGVPMTKPPFKMIPVKHNSHKLWYTDVSSDLGLSREEYSAASAHSRF